MDRKLRTFNKNKSSVFLTLTTILFFCIYLLSYGIVIAAAPVIPPSAPGITQLTGDVTAGPGNGSQAATVVRIGGVTPGTAVGYSVGTSGGVLGLLNTVNTISGANTYTALQTFSANIALNNGNAGAPSLYYGTNTGIFGSNSTLDFSVGGALKGCFVGNAYTVGSACATDTVGGQTPSFQVRNNSGQTAVNATLLAAYQASGIAGAGVYCAKSRSSTLGTQAALNSGDAICYHYDEGSDGTAFQPASLVETLVDSTVSSGVVPGRIVISTANAAGVMTEGMRINSAQHVSFSGAAPTISGGTLDAYASDNEGTITASAASLSVTFAKAFLVYARCLPTSEAGLTLTYSFSLTGLTISATGLSGTKVDYQCHGQ